MMRIFQIGPYPIDSPLHGGQIRVAQIHKRLRDIGAIVQYTGVWLESQYTAHSNSYILVPSQSPWINHNFPYLVDYFTGMHLVNDNESYKRLSDKLSVFRPTLIWIEQPWMWPAVHRWIKDAKYDCQVCYSSQNVEHELKRQMHVTSGKWWADKADMTQFIEYLDKIEKMERECTVNTQLCVATSENDAVAFRNMGANRVVVAPNGVVRRVIDQKRAKDWQHFFGKKRYVAFVGSGHPPNATGFWECLGSKIGFLRPNEFILAIGGVCSLLRESREFKDLGSLAENRIQLAGVVTEADLTALLAGACGIILPIRTGGGTNLKTAEALATGKPIVATSTALRGYDFAHALNNVVVADNEKTFRTGIRRLFDATDNTMPELQPVEMERHAVVFWDHCLTSITLEMMASTPLDSLHIGSQLPITREARRQPDAFLASKTQKKAIEQNFPHERRCQILVDISTLVQVDAESGIQRATRSVLREWLLHPPEGWSVEPVYAIPDIQGYRYARRFTSRFLGINKAWAVDSPMDAWAGDVFVGLDLAAHLVPKQEPFLSDLRNRGITVMFVIYDLLPLLRSDWWADDMNPVFTEWMRTIGRISDSLVCISQATLEDLRNWLDFEQPQRYQPLRLGYFYLGSDIENSPLRVGQAGDFKRTLQNLKVRPTFLMVGTIEPRKGYAQTLAAFERLWAREHDINLVIVGKQGWKVEPLAKQLQHHTETRRRLFWLQNISDEYLTMIYASSTCLIAASLAEGFGLPLIEAARHKLPIIARDIPVFREVTGENAFYFKGDKPEELAEAIKQWISLQSQGKEPKSDNMQWLTWLQSAKTLEAMLMEENHPQWIQTWQPGRRWCLRASDPRFHSQVGQRSPEGVHSRGIAGYLLYGHYIQVPAGDYELSLYGCAGPQGLDGAEVDVCIERGEIILAKSPLQSDGLDIVPCGQNRELVRFVFQNERLASDLEIRVWTSEISMFTITRVEFSPVKVTKTM